MYQLFGVGRFACRTYTGVCGVVLVALVVLIAVTVFPPTLRFRGLLLLLLLLPVLLLLLILVSASLVSILTFTIGPRVDMLTNLVFLSTPFSPSSSSPSSSSSSWSSSLSSLSSPSMTASLSDSTCS